MNILKGKGIILPIQRQILLEIGEISELSCFYLSGGTALAEFYFAHRRSYDLDFFTSKIELILPSTKILEKKLLQRGYDINIISRFESFIEYEIKKKDDSVILHFAYDTPFKFEEPQLSEFGVKVSNYTDLIIDKLLTFFSRWKERDAIDLYFIMKNEHIEKLMEMAKQKDPGFDLYWFCCALREVKDFPDDINKWPVDMLIDVNIKDLKDKFLHLAFKIMDEIREGKI